MLGRSLLLTAVLLAGSVQAQAICGSKNTYLAQLSVVAQVAHALCPEIGEISQTELGVLALDAGIDIKRASCNADLGRAIANLRAEHERGPARWCDNARVVMERHPVTKRLVDSKQALAPPKPHPLEADCNELARVFVMVTKARDVCRFEVTPAGAVILTFPPTEQCRQRFSDQMDEAIAVRSKLYRGDAEKGRDGWCAMLDREHAAQARSDGIKAFFIRRGK